MIRVKIHELAAREFEEAIEWYQHQSKGLGNRFKKSVIEQVKKMALLEFLWICFHEI
ncbi:MAG: hypothetical protein GXO76_06685 [Calditrichaeota bacterium]|nr:hypothetical protein [Calditrichota bacterium]